ncbi:DUF4062 domain-containing protein [Nitrospira sp. CMX1]
MERPRLFLSAVSEELRTARQTMARTVRTLGFDPVSQDDFPTGYGELRQWLREQLDSAEGLIQLAGVGYGAEPPEVDPDYGRISYTQFEFLYAYKQKKKTWLIVIDKDFPRDKASDQLDLPRDDNHPDPASYQAERRTLQQHYLARLRQQNHLRHTASNLTELDNIVLRLRDKLGELRREWDDWLQKDAGFKSRTLAKQDYAEAKLDKVAAMLEAIYAASATQTASERTDDVVLRAQREEIEALRAQVQAGAAQHQADLTNAEKQYVAELAARDRVYAQEIVVFRKAVKDIADTPEGVAALTRFNAGDEPGAITVLDQLRAAHNAARQKRADLESAAEGRRIATLALEARTRGKLTTAQVITRYEEVTRLDPGVHWDWIELGRLYEDSGNLPGALRAAQAAGVTAEDERDQSVANNAIGDVLVAQGDLPAALTAFRAGLGIAEALAMRDPANTGWQRDLYVSYWRLADLAEKQKATKEALTYWKQAYDVLSKIDKRGLHLSPEDRQYLATLQEKVRAGAQ